MALHDRVRVLAKGYKWTGLSGLGRSTLLSAPYCIAAFKNDRYGEMAARQWLAYAPWSARITPPLFWGKDWFEAHANRLDLGTWWSRVLDDLDSRPLPTSAKVITRRASSAPTVGPCSNHVGSPLPDHPLWEVNRWPVDWRLYWGGLANRFEYQGMKPGDAGARAFELVKAERQACDYGPAPVLSPDPGTEFWHHFLGELMSDGTAEQFATAAERDHAAQLLVAEPLDGESIRGLVHAIQERYWAAKGFPPKRAQGQRWRCQYPGCTGGSRWWKSPYGVVQCMHCRPPAGPELIVAEGDSASAPFVDPDRSNQAISERAGDHAMATRPRQGAAHFGSGGPDDSCSSRLE